MINGPRSALLPKLDKTTAAMMLAGLCTFLNVYSTQPLLPLLRQFHCECDDSGYGVDGTVYRHAR